MSILLKQTPIQSNSSNYYTECKSLFETRETARELIRNKEVAAGN